MSNVTDLVDKAEPIIRVIAFRVGRCGLLDVDDIRQELRIEAMQIARSFDESRAPWLPHVARLLRLRVMDIFRENGPTTRSGRKRIRFSSVNQKFDNGDDNTIEDSREGGEASVDWRDLVERCADADLAVRAVLMLCEGLTKKDISVRLGVSESLVTHLMMPRYGRIQFARQRLKHLIIGNNPIPIPTLPRREHT